MFFATQELDGPSYLYDWSSGAWTRLPSAPGGVGSGMACAAVRLRSRDGGGGEERWGVAVLGEGSRRAQVWY